MRRTARPEGRGFRTAAEIRRELMALADPAQAAQLQRFFKTGPGQYGAGDRFLGLRVPQVRACIRRGRALSRAEIRKLLRASWHEIRLLAVLLMADRYRRGGPLERQELFEDYLAHTRYINNWDLVDVSAPQIIGAHLDPDRIDVLDRLAGSSSLWERRIAMLATLHWIRAGVFRPALHIAGRLLHDDHDLIHKAVGWMLREIGRRDRAVEERFLRRHYRTMPRTALRIALEHFPEARRRAYLEGTID